MYREIRRTIATATAVGHPVGRTNVVVPLRRKAAPPPGFNRYDRDGEPEALAAVLSLGAVLLVIVVSIAMKLWLH